MAEPPLAIPAHLAATAPRWMGEAGRAWLAALPRLVRALADEWDLVVGDPYEPGGNISWVAPARRRDGRSVALKVQCPHPESDPEAAGLRAWAGEGAVLLHAADADRRALLVEACAPGHPITREGGTAHAVRTAAALGRRLHAVAPPTGLPTLATVLASWADEVEERRRPGALADERLVDLGLEVMRGRPTSVPGTVLLHGDLNPTNVLAAEREPWLAIDPKPMVGDPAYDGPRLVLQPDPLLTADPAATVAERLAIVAGEMGLDRDGLVLWCLADAVQQGVGADPATAARCDAHVELLRPHLP